MVSFTKIILGLIIIIATAYTFTYSGSITFNKITMSMFTQSPTMALLFGLLKIVLFPIGLILIVKGFELDVIHAR